MRKRNENEMKWKKTLTVESVVGKRRAKGENADYQRRQDVEGGRRKEGKGEGLLA